MNENNPKVALTNEQRETLAGALDIFAEALRERRELRVRDFQDIAGEVRHFQQSPNSSHPGPDDPLDRGRMVSVDEIRIMTSTQIAGREAPTHDDLVKRYPKSVREQFPRRAAYFVRPIPEGPCPPSYSQSLWSATSPLLIPPPTSLMLSLAGHPMTLTPVWRN